MANNANIVKNNPASNRRGPKPIQTVAQLRDNLLRDALAKELRKIDKRIATATRKRKVAHDRANDATKVIDSLTKLRAEFIAESGLNPKA
jgi:uncharacterized membrane-anchored protein